MCFGNFLILIRECGRGLKLCGGSVGLQNPPMSCRQWRWALAFGGWGQRLRDQQDTPTHTHWLSFENFWEAMKQVLKGYKRRGDQPLAVHYHHQRTLTIRYAPTTRGLWPPAQRLPLDPRVVIPFLLFNILSVFLFSRHIRVMSL